MKKSFFFIVLVIISCSNGKKDRLVNYEKSIDSRYCDTFFTNDNYLLPDTLEYCQECLEWELDASIIMEILVFSEKTGFNEIDARSLTLPCEYKGEAIINGKRIYYGINGGGYTAFSCDGKTIFSVYRKKNDFFIEKPWIPLDDN